MPTPLGAALDALSQEPQERRACRHRRGHRQHPQGQGGNRYPDTDHRDLQAHLEGQKTYAINLAWTVDGPPLTRNLMTTCPSGAMVYARLELQRLIDSAGAETLEDAAVKFRRLSAYVEEGQPARLLAGALVAAVDNGPRSRSVGA